MPRLEPVDHDPFVSPPAKPTYLLPVDHDPFVERGFLGALDLAERAGLGGTSLRLYNDLVAKGRRTSVTERDFSPAELATFRQLATTARDKSGKATGVVGPEIYDDLMMQGGRPDYNMIGGFAYETAPDGGVVIHDTYDFNLDRAGKPGIEGQGGLFQAITSPVGMAASIGRKRLPDSSGGVPINIRIPPPAPAPDKQYRLEPIDHDPFAQ